MQHKGNSERRWGGLWKGLKPAFWELSQAPLLTFFPEKHHPQSLDPGCYFWQRPLLMPRPTPAPPQYRLSSSDTAYTRACSQLWGGDGVGVTSGCLNGALFPRPWSQEPGTGKETMCVLYMGPRA